MISLLNINRTFKLGFKSLWLHKLRSALTALGIIFGVGSVIAMLAIGEGASRDTQEKIAKLGSKNIILRTIKPAEEQSSIGQQQQMTEYGLMYEDAERFQTGIPNVTVIVPSRRLNQQTQYRTKRVNIEVIGTVSWHPDISNLRIKSGRFITDVDMQSKKGICVVDEKVVRDLFGLDDPIWQTVKIGTDYYTVVGITNEGTISTTDIENLKSNPSQASSGGQGSGAKLGNIFIPITTVKDRFGETTMQMGTSGQTLEKIELQEIIIQAKSIDDVLAANRNVKTILTRFHKKNDYEIIVPLEQMKQAREVQRIFTIVLASIAAISLLVGGIGIMNIMLASVSERTREIGIRRALGARKLDIIWQFLSETLMLTLLGGLLGIVLGSMIPFVVSHFSNMPTAITISSLVLAFGISAAVGITFGMYPAYRAANMDPIESLRHE